MVGAELHAATGSAITIRHHANAKERLRPARSRLLLPTTLGFNG
jgi:hypothetical protein